MRGQVLDALGEERHLYFRGACVAFVAGVLPDQGLFRFLGQQTCSFDFLYLSSGVKVARGGGSSNLPALVLLSGLPGTGKTTFAAKLAPRLAALVLESDRVRRELFPRRRYTRKESGQVFAVVRERAEAALGEGRSVIIDATNLREGERRGFRELAAGQGAPVVAVRLTAPDAVVRERLSGVREGASEANVGVYNRMRGQEEPFGIPCVQVDSRYCLEASVALAAALCRGEA
ncbi:MAG: ATP-binding protein [Dehalococcoidia bacterium]|nr:ATP-binding protein [Dehalococcoidia bacterium]